MTENTTINDRKYRYIIINHIFINNKFHHIHKKNVK